MIHSLFFLLQFDEIRNGESDEKCGENDDLSLHFDASEPQLIKETPLNLLFISRTTFYFVSSGNN